MRICGKHAYLVYRRPKLESPASISVVARKESVIRQWTPCTRISPLFLFSHGNIQSPTSDTFRGLSRLVFLGPVHPEQIVALCTRETRVWLTLGTFNLVICE